MYACAFENNKDNGLEYSKWQSQRSTWIDSFSKCLTDMCVTAQGCIQIKGKIDNHSCLQISACRERKNERHMMITWSTALTFLTLVEMLPQVSYRTAPVECLTEKPPTACCQKSRVIWMVEKCKQRSRQTNNDKDLQTYKNEQQQQMRKILLRN